MANLFSNVKSIFYPKSVALIGASDKKGTIGYGIINNMVSGGYKGKIYPVNPKSDTILNIKSYPSVKAIPDEVEMAVVIISSAHVCNVMEECGQKGVKGAVVISSGFKEVGKEGKELENKLVEIITRYNIPFVGPNCLGIINAASNAMMNVSFAHTPFPRSGNISFISQSGALCTAVLDYAQEEKIGFAKFVSMGNKAVLGENEFLMYLKDDPETKVILMYVEDLVNGKAFIDIARQITSKKPVVILRAGRTAAGAKAASSHTGALAGTDEVYEAAFAQTGVIRVQTIEELFNLGIAFANSPLPKGKRTAVVSNAGGLAIIATDACIANNLELAPFEEKTTKLLHEKLVPVASKKNPVDMTGNANYDCYGTIVDAVMKDVNVDSVITLIAPHAAIDIPKTAEVICDIFAKKNKTMLVSFSGMSSSSEPVRMLKEHNVPTAKFPEALLKILKYMNDYNQWLERDKNHAKVFNVDKQKVKSILEKIKKEGRTYLPEIEATEVLKAYGFPVLKSVLAKNEEECVKAANEIKYPVAMKISSPDIVHKFDVKGVILNIKSDAEVKEAYRAMIGNIKKNVPNAKIWGVAIQEMCTNFSSGVETIIGIKKEAGFGSMLMFGLGGTNVEVLKDVTFRVAPVDGLDSHEMIRSIKAYKLLDGVRGNLPSDTDSIAECLQRLSQLVVDFEEITELDMNPLVVFSKGSGCKVLDARISI